ncbi:hypothetical protein DPMN_106383 [Dreissena polymorpha]|uniref:SAP domain-containing protein n=1 Tax=Dreissena polymorpha TaxID=45954 RepID=A0A9D4K529_DREPO|nr:hypothetical protein DPMN_106383 [Dreissena polymorpha]
MSEFSSFTVAELNIYLKDRGISLSGNRKAELVQLCVTAKELQIAVDPDGLSENKAQVISQKLLTGDCNLTSPDLHEGTSDISNLPGISIFDIYKYLISYDQFSHATLREYRRLEGFCMLKEGYVMQLETVSYHGTGRLSQYV